MLDIEASGRGDALPTSPRRRMSCPASGSVVRGRPSAAGPSGGASAAESCLVRGHSVLEAACPMADH